MYTNLFHRISFDAHTNSHHLYGVANLSHQTRTENREMASLSDAKITGMAAAAQPRQRRSSSSMNNAIATLRVSISDVVNVHVSPNPFLCVWANRKGLHRFVGRGCNVRSSHRGRPSLCLAFRQLIQRAHSTPRTAVSTSNTPDAMSTDSNVHILYTTVGARWRTSPFACVTRDARGVSTPRPPWCRNVSKTSKHASPAQIDSAKLCAES